MRFKLNALLLSIAALSIPAIPAQAQLWSSETPAPKFYCVLIIDSEQGTAHSASTQEHKLLSHSSSPCLPFQSDQKQLNGLSDSDIPRTKPMVKKDRTYSSPVPLVKSPANSLSNYRGGSGSGQGKKPVTQKPTTNHHSLRK